ncbi:MAG TPA: M20/M25/M40 family metallo-hydrolase [Candidatus Saccharimonadia bacterium]|jgi:succinyl-diaminopimelate desuccinylase|nr:M20/M25/M40 family metallo-hydrolase [Candidatus Saccharimonadia bacterium]
MLATNEIIELTKRLIKIPSTADNPAALREAIEVLANVVAACPGVHIEWFEQGGKPSFLAYRGNVRPKKFDIILNAHLDVVPAAPAQFKARVKDGKMYGRGALDMKGTAAALTTVFCELVQDIPYALGLQIVTDEEIGGYNGVRAQIDDGVRAEFVVIGEYANDRNTIYNAARGLCWAEIAFKGKTAHGGHLWNGSNAVLKAGSFAAAVITRYPTPDKETWTTTASVASLSTPNETYNKVPDSAVLKIDFRFTQEDPVFQNRETLEAFIAEIDPDAELVNVATFEPAVNVEELNPYVQGLSAAMVNVTNIKPKFLGRPGGSDGRHYAMVNNDIIEFGLYGQGSHSDAEYVRIASFEEYYKIMRAFLLSPLPPADQGAQIKRLTEQLAAGKAPAYVWYATYGSGLSKQNFACQILGGQSGGISHIYKGCTDKTLPVRDEFISLPYSIYFAGHCVPCDGGHIGITTTPSPDTHTIARAHLVTAQQFKELVAEQNGRQAISDLPFKAAIEHGHATITDGTGSYDELVFCGIKDSIPMFALTATHPELPYLPPSPGYARLLSLGLSENENLSLKTAADYIFTAPGVAGNYQKRDILELFKDQPS